MGKMIIPDMCGNCKFHLQEGKGDEKRMICRRYPPQWVVVAVPHQRRGMNEQGVMGVIQEVEYTKRVDDPGVLPAGWCGEHQKEEVKEK